METMEQTTNALVRVVETSGLKPEISEYLKERFLPFFNKVEEWKGKTEALIVSDASQTSEMKMAREARLALKNIRVNADKIRKALKEDSLRYGKAVQGVFNVIEKMITPLEKHLERQEKFIEIQEAERRVKLKVAREVELQPFEEFIPYGLDLANMSDEDYGNLLNGGKLQLQAKVKAEKQRLAKEKAEAKERERIKVENEKLKAEAVARDKQLAEEKKAREKVEAELKLKQEAVVRARMEAEKAKKEADRKFKAAKAAPDKAKLIEFANVIDELVSPELKSEEAQAVLTDVRVLLNKVSNYIREKTTTI